jgi:hypothetical protein
MGNVVVSLRIHIGQIPHIGLHLNLMLWYIHTTLLHFLPNATEHFRTGIQLRELFHELTLVCPIPVTRLGTTVLCSTLHLELTNH